MAFLIVVFTATFFTWTLPIVQAYRLGHPWLLFTMPILILPLLWDRLQPRDTLSTRQEVVALDGEGAAGRPVSWLAGFKQIFMTLLAHLVGASVGREAVGLQLGGWAARLRGTRGWYFGACLAAGFAIIMGTPFAAAVFIFESRRWRMNWSEWVGVPLLAWLAYRLSILLGASHFEYRSFDVTLTELRLIGFPSLALFTFLYLTLAVVLSFGFLYCVAHVTRALRKPDTSLRTQLFWSFSFLLAVGVLFGVFSERVEGSGLSGLGVAILPGLWLAQPQSYTVFNHPLLFGTLKIFSTALFVGFGIRGGELTPLLFAGAMIAVGLGALLHLPVAGLVAIGFPVVWGIAAKRPMTAAVIAIELFGFSPYGSIAVITGLMVVAGLAIGDLVLAKTNGAKIIWRRGLYNS